MALSDGNEPNPQIEAPLISEVQPKSADPKLEAAHFWVVSSRYLQSALLLTPPLSLIQANYQVSLELFDADGCRAGSMQAEFPAGQLGVIELDPLMSGCKFESGMRHGRVRIECAQGARVVCRYFSSDSVSLAESASALSLDRSTFFPLHFSGDRSEILAVMNSGSELLDVRCRLFVGKRSPEVVWSVPAGGTRLFDLREEFSSLLEAEPAVRGYVRISTKSIEGGALQFIERQIGAQRRDLFQVVN